MPRPIQCEISIAAMRHNLACVKALGGTRKNWAVVKANAYGHGIVQALAALSEADGLALVEFDYALQLRELGWKKPILMLEGAFSYADTELARRHDISLAVHQVRQAQWLEQSAGQTAIGIWLKINTGMNRLGFSSDSLSALIQGQGRGALRARLGANHIGLSTHFANSDLIEAKDKLMPQTQVDRLQQVLALIGTQHIDAISVANSSAILGYTELDQSLSAALGQIEVWQRPGIMLYGSSPYANLARQSPAHFNLKPAMALQAEVLCVQSLAAGQSIGYGSRFVATQAMKAAVIACGYADGYPRHAPDGTPVVVASKRCPIAGRVSMDMLVVDVSAAPDCREGSTAQLWGAELPIDEVAQSAGTIGYELMCAVAARVQRTSTDSFLS